MSDNFELAVLSGGRAYFPRCVERVSWETSRKNAPARLAFSLAEVGAVPLAEGDCVRFSAEGREVFAGFVFGVERSSDGRAEALCYDQLRYLKNRDSYVYEQKTASEVVRMIAADYGLKVGEIEDTVYRIPSRVESGASLFDIIGNALDITVSNTGREFVLFDNCGRIELRSPENLRVDIMIDAENAEEFEFKSSIDSGVYNKIKIAKSRENSRDFFTARDDEKIRRWGVLQYYSGAGGAAEAASLLDLYGSPNRFAEIKNAAGDARVRGGSAVAVDVRFGDLAVRKFVLVERARHEFRNGVHLMNLSCVVRGE